MELLHERPRAAVVLREAFDAAQQLAVVLVEVAQARIFAAQALVLLTEGCILLERRLFLVVELDGGPAQHISLVRQPFEHKAMELGPNAALGWREILLEDRGHAVLPPLDRPQLVHVCHP